jgi:hypothetical protein
MFGYCKKEETLFRDILSKTTKTEEEEVGFFPVRPQDHKKMIPPTKYFLGRPTSRSILKKGPFN